MTIHRLVTWCLVVPVVLLVAAPGASAQTLKPEMLAQFEQKTGLKPVEIADTHGAYVGKTHRGYEVLFTAKAGNVWGRYAARLTMAEIGREVGGFAAHVTGQRGRIGESVVGSPLDRLLSRYLGHPITIAIALVHGKPHAPRLDVLSDRAKVGPEDVLARRDKIGGNAGYIYADDADIVRRITSNEALMNRLKKLRYEYVRLDADAVTCFFAGTELDYSALIRDYGDYFKMLNDLMDNLADIADAIPAER
ncbi:MAG TPA: hypothetical protein VFO48_07605 [Vicinamibacterales bacterium]|nr:hypothetical protein [Vicinamibacterales bacterium]